MSDRQIVWIDQERCTGCGACVEVCPAEAISLLGDTARVDEDLCTGCHACVDACPQGAIELIIEGQAVPVPQKMVPAAQARSLPVETARAPVAALGIEVLSRAAEALVRVLERRLTQPSSNAASVSQESRTGGGGTGGGGRGRRERRRRRGE